jgi:hypothetical protein
MRLSTVFASFAACLLLAGAGPGNACGGWFGLGGSDKPAEASKASKPSTAATAKKPAASSPATRSTSKSLFGSTTGASKTSKPDAKKKTSLYAPKSTNADKNKNPSWWNSWSKTKDPPAPKTTDDWMKLKQVQY